MNLKDFIKTNNMTVSFFVRKLGVSYPYGWNLVHGKRRPSPDIAKKIIAITKGKVSWDDIYP